MPPLDATLAAQWAESTLGHIGQEYPNSLLHVWQSAADAVPPSVLHPIFFGSYDWHSCVHGWWQLLRIARRFPDLPEVAAIRTKAASTFTPADVAGEAAYFARPGTTGFERPYGWAWLLALHDEASRLDDGALGIALQPLATIVAGRFRTYLPKLVYPVRHGVHSNTAFALVLSFDWASRHDPALAALIAARAVEWFGADTAVRPIEPSGEDFLSPTLCAAALMCRVLDPPAFATWFAAYLPDIPSTLCAPATVSDRSDGRLAHLDGLNLSRAWAWRVIGEALDNAEFQRVADAHVAAALPHLFDHYMGEHWLATFAVLALDEREAVDQGSRS